VLVCIRIKRQSSIKGDQLPNVGGIEERLQPRFEGGAIPRLAGQDKREARGLIA
jgi:hypothetical protein